MTADGGFVCDGGESGLCPEGVGNHGRLSTGGRHSHICDLDGSCRLQVQMSMEDVHEDLR